MAATNCLDFLNNYADTLSANTDITGFRPRPVFFTGTNCSGKIWPPVSKQITDGLDASTTYNNVQGNDFGSMYIPGGWQVVFIGPPGTTTFPPTETSLPTLLTDAAATPFSAAAPSSSLSNNVSTAQVIYPINPDKTTISDTQWKLDMCTSQISTVVGARHLTSWQQGSTECDTFMDGYCAPVSGLSCAPNSTEPAPLSTQFKPCVCLVEQNCLRQVFCEPGNTNPGCVNDDAFEEFIPVTCFGRNCSQEGYRFGRMQDQRCNITLCQQIIRLVGNDIVVKGGSTIWCGNQSIPVGSVTPSPSDVEPGGVTLPVYAWVLIGVTVFILFVTIPLAIIVYRRDKKRRLENAPPSERPPLKPAAATTEF